jgi:uncharacterized protein YkwD
MKKMIMKLSMVLLVMSALLGAQSVDASAKIKTKKYTLDLRGGGELIRQPSVVRKAKKVTVKSSNKAVVKVKYLKKKKEIYLKAKKEGSAVVSVTCRMKNGKIQKIRYKIKVIRSVPLTPLQQSKKAFAIQNQYREEKGVTKLEWSDELYQFALYRLKTSGFDAHKNLDRDMNDYFGEFAGYKGLLLSENLATGATAKIAMSLWKKSEGHYRNLLDSEHVCGAIAHYQNVWIAIFYDKGKEELVDWKSNSVKKITVKRYDSTSGSYLSGSRFAYYVDDDKANTMKVDTIGDASGKSIYLEVGKTYVIYERITPDGYEKANTVTITVTEDSPSEIVLSN